MKKKSFFSKLGDFVIKNVFFTSFLASPFLLTKVQYFFDYFFYYFNNLTLTFNNKKQITHFLKIKMSEPLAVFLQLVILVIFVFLIKEFSDEIYKQTQNSHHHANVSDDF